MLAAEEPAGERVVRDDGDVLLGAQRQQLALVLTEQQVVSRLHADEAGRAQHLGAPDAASQLVSEEVAAPDVANLAAAHHIVERLQRLVDRSLCIP